MPWPHGWTHHPRDSGFVCVPVSVARLFSWSLQQTPETMKHSKKVKRRWPLKVDDWKTWKNDYSNLEGNIGFREGTSANHLHGFHPNKQRPLCERTASSCRLLRLPSPPPTWAAFQTCKEHLTASLEKSDACTKCVQTRHQVLVNSLFPMRIEKASGVWVTVAVASESYIPGKLNAHGFWNGLPVWT